ncbi:DUF4935 domain-containing protein [Clostridium botulinum]|nr:DUF4935 domain-containing protein [Clostridium botulinum]EKS4395269.1 DUF4935 domain-containing protein [Clostridium botulinum]
MNENNIVSYYINPEREEQLWKDCIFVFDTSSLLEFYYYSPKSQQEIFDTTFEKIKNRLWIPGHVEYEYLRNRKNIISKLIDEKYDKLINEFLQPASKDILNVIKKVNELYKHTEKDNLHPYINKKITQTFKDRCNEFKEEYDKFNIEVTQEIKRRKKEIESTLNNDSILNKFKEFFTVGKEFNFNQIMGVVKEGQIRYKNEIPPGYEDGKGPKRKEGTQMYGDLIIWKQIIEFAKENKKTICLIINDVKPDWCYSNKRGNEHRIDRPKEDLIREIKDEANVEFWMYTFSQFLYKSRNLLNIKIKETVIKEVESVSKQQIIENDKKDSKLYKVSDIAKLLNCQCFEIYRKMQDNKFIIKDYKSDNVEENIMSMVKGWNESIGHSYLIENIMPYTIACPLYFNESLGFGKNEKYSINGHIECMANLEGYKEYLQKFINDILDSDSLEKYIQYENQFNKIFS